MLLILLQLIRKTASEARLLTSSMQSCAKSSSCGGDYKKHLKTKMFTLMFMPMPNPNRLGFLPLSQKLSELAASINTCFSVSRGGSSCSNFT